VWQKKKTRRKNTVPKNENDASFFFLVEEKE